MTQFTRYLLNIIGSLIKLDRVYFINKNYRAELTIALYYL